MDHRKGRHEGLWRRKPPQAPASHGIGLREAVHDDCPVRKLRIALGKARELVRIDKPLIHIVADHIEVMLTGQLSHSSQAFLREHGACRIQGRVQDDGLGLGAHKSSELFLLYLEAVL